MENNIQPIGRESLVQAYRRLLELEGYVSLAIDRGDSTPDEVWRQIGEIAAALPQMFNVVSDSQLAGSQPEPVGDYIEQFEAESVDDTADDEPTTQPPVVPQDDPLKSNPNIILVELDDDDDEPQPAEESDEPIEDADDDDVMPVEPSRLEALRRMFTINDRFRFRRELFGNSDSAMADTINLIAAMSSLDEAEDYLYNDLAWDPNTPEVEEFNEIIVRFFNNN